MENNNLRSVYIDMTPELAQKYLDTQVRNRSLNQRWVTALTNAIKRGEWILDGNSIKMDENGHLIDGQHRLEAVVRSGITVPMEVKSGFKPEAIFVMDAFVRPRTVGDVLSLNGVKNANAVASGIQVFLMEMRGIVSNSSEYKVSPTFIMKVYNENPDVWQHFATFSIRSAQMDKDRLNLVRPSQICGYASYLHLVKKHEPERIEYFFNNLCSSKESKNVSIEKLRQTLLRNAVAQKKYTKDTLRALLVKTWNGYITGVTVRCLKVQKNETRIEFI